MVEIRSGKEREKREFFFFFNHNLFSIHGFSNYVCASLYTLF